MSLDDVFLPMFLEVQRNYLMKLVNFLLFLLLFCVVGVGCQGDDTRADRVPQVVNEEGGESEKVDEGEVVVDVKPVVVVMRTDMGDIEIALNPGQAPKTVANFLGYVDKKHYDGVIFHRVMANFMIQTGGMDADMSERETGDPVDNEASNGLKNDRGTIAMARTGHPHSATAQFFINVVDNDGLNYKGPSMSGFGYCVFGKVIAGMDVVDKIRAVETGNKGRHANVPVEPIVLKEVRRK